MSEKTKGQEEPGEQLKFVTIELSKKQIDLAHPKTNEKNGKDYVRVFAPERGTFFYPVESLKDKKDNPNRVYFSRPEGAEITVYYSHRKEGIPDDAPNKEKYENTSRIVKIEDLKRMYTAERQAFIDKKNEERDLFVNMTVPTSWGKAFEGKDGRNYVSISVPVKEGEENRYYSFVISADRFRTSDKEEGMSYFGFPKHFKDNEIEPYTIQLKRSVKQEDGSYKDIVKTISSEDLKEAVDAAKKQSAVKELFMGVKVSDRLVRKFESKDGKKLASLSVPVYMNEQAEQPTYFQIILPVERVKETAREGTVYVSMYKKGKDGEDFIFKAKSSTWDDNVKEYVETEKYLTSSEVVKCFETARQKFLEGKNNKNLEKKDAAEDEWLNAPEVLEDEMFPFNKESEPKQQQLNEPQQRKAKHGR